MRDHFEPSFQLIKTALKDFQFLVLADQCDPNGPGCELPVYLGYQGDSVFSNEELRIPIQVHVLSTGHGPIYTTVPRFVQPIKYQKNKLFNEKSSTNICHPVIRYGRLKADSKNSDKPPSADNPLRKKRHKKSKGRPGAKKGHKGHPQVMLEPTKTVSLKPERCGCGCRKFKGLEAFYTHQEIELPEIQMEVAHFVLHKGRCAHCGKINKAQMPVSHKTGYGPRLTALVGKMAGIHGNSKATIQEFFASVFNLRVSKSAIQKMIERSSKSLEHITTP